MTQIDDSRNQQAGVPQQPQWVLQGPYPGAPSGPWQQPMPFQQFAAPAAPFPGAQGYWQWLPNMPGPVFVQQPAPARPANGTAIFAFVMSLLWLFGIGAILGLIFGIVAARECNRTGEPGNGLATAAAILGLFGLLFSPAIFAAL